MWLKTHTEPRKRGLIWHSRDPIPDSDRVPSSRYLHTWTPFRPIKSYRKVQQMVVRDRVGVRVEKDRGLRRNKGLVRCKGGSETHTSVEPTGGVKKETGWSPIKSSGQNLVEGSRPVSHPYDRPTTSTWTRLHDWLKKGVPQRKSVYEGSLSFRKVFVLTSDLESYLPSEVIYLTCNKGRGRTTVKEVRWGSTGLCVEGR